MERTETIEMVADHFQAPVNPNLKVGENERLSFYKKRTETIKMVAADSQAPVNPNLKGWGE